MKVGRFCVSSWLCGVCSTTSVQALSSRASAFAGGYLGFVCGSSTTACVTSCSPSSLHRCRYLAVRAQPRGRLVKLLMIACIDMQACSVTAQRLPRPYDTILSSSPPKLSNNLVVHAQCLEAEFYSWVANGRGLTADVAGTPRIV